MLVRNGDLMVGEMNNLERGQLEFKTDAKSTVYVKWPRIVNVTTQKIFEIELADGSVLFGSLTAGTQDSVVIRTDSLTMTVPTQSVVCLQRIKASFWKALDGNLNLGIDFTQQNSKADFNLSGEVHYAHEGEPDTSKEVLRFNKFSSGYAYTRLDYNATYSRQDSTDDIQRFNAALSHLRQLRDRWFWLVARAIHRGISGQLDSPRPGRRLRVLHVGNARHQYLESTQRDADPRQLGTLAHQFHAECESRGAEEFLCQHRCH